MREAPWKRPTCCRPWKLGRRKLGRRKRPTCCQPWMCIGVWYRPPDSGGAGSAPWTENAKDPDGKSEQPSRRGVRRAPLIIGKRISVAFGGKQKGAKERNIFYSEGRRTTPKFPAAPKTSLAASKIKTPSKNAKVAPPPLTTPEWKTR